MSASTKSASEIKEEGNQCVKEGKYTEAIIHYSKALKLDPNNHTLFSNRSFAFLKVQQYALAMEDAISTIKLQKDWPKGYFRKAEVELATHRYLEAFNSYKQALYLQPEDSYVAECLRKTGEIIRQERKADEQVPWVGAGVGLIVGVFIVIADILTNKPTLNHPFLMVLLTIVVAMIGFGIAKLCRWYTKVQRSSLLDANAELLNGTCLGTQNAEAAEGSEEVKGEQRNTPRYTKAQARQRMKKGKM